MGKKAIPYNNVELQQHSTTWCRWEPWNERSCWVTKRLEKWPEIWYSINCYKRILSAQRDLLSTSLASEWITTKKGTHHGWSLKSGIRLLSTSKTCQPCRLPKKSWSSYSQNAWRIFNLIRAWKNASLVILERRCKRPLLIQSASSFQEGLCGCVVGVFNPSCHIWQKADDDKG